jgi:hypothetical protein
MATVEVDVHYGHLCNIRVTKFDIVDTFGGAQAASVVFQVQANKTRAYRSFPIRVAYDPTTSPISAVRNAWKQLTGHDISLDGSSTGGTAPSAGQLATLAEIKEFVRSETQKVGVNLTLDVI